MSTSESHFWTRKAFAVGLLGMGSVVFLAFGDSMYSIFVDESTPLMRYRVLRDLATLGAFVFMGCSVFLAIRSWALLFPRPYAESGYRPIIWAILLTGGVFITPWFVIHRAMKEGEV